MVRKIEYTASVTGAAFMGSDAQMRVLMGPVGCIAGDTKIRTEDGDIPICDISHRARVLSWNATRGRFEHRLATCGYPKGRDYLYRVVTRHGEFVAAGFHRVYAGGSNYQRVDKLVPGQCVSQCLVSRRGRFWGVIPEGLVSGDRSCRRIAAGYLESYGGLARQYGQRLLMGVGICPELVQGQGGVRGLSLHGDFGGFLRKGGRWVQRRLHSRQYQCGARKGTDDFFGRVEHPRLGGEGYTFARLFGHILGRVRWFLRFPRRIVRRLLGRLLFWCCGSRAPSLSEGAIISIERLEVKQTYWDMQVPDTNNYVTSDGTIHHNSGKSVTSCFEIIKRASEQRPDADGIRRSRALIVRQTLRQLMDTTMKTFFDWFPPGVCGEYMKTIKTFYFRVGDVSCEIMFRALDDADDVGNLSSLELTFAWFNECRDINPEIVGAMRKRIGRYPANKDGGASWYGMWGDTNPPTMGTWWYYQMEGLNPKDGVSLVDNGWEVFKQPSGRSALAENVEHLIPNYYDTKGSTEEYIRVYIDGEYGLSSAGQPVYKYFRPDYHMANETLVPMRRGERPIIVGVDLGLTPAAVIGQLDARGRALIYDEAVSFDMGIQRFIRTKLKPLLFERFRGAPILIVVDPAGMQRAQTDEKRVVDIIRAEKLEVIPASTNKVSARLNAVDSYLMRQVEGKSAFLIDPRCRHLKAAMMGGYRFHKITGKIEKDKRHSHIAEALQYLMLHIDSYQGLNRVQARAVKQVSCVGWT